ncbi:unnamed protein product [Kluyveromyces dobzhanskii CBS 2104]|uniref:Mediator of RNA polymerase II transcription subunit 19 n=1 Tax=Kluyveromyces dobzhanskii CBS 2104 TaxID=1427455 RepID=A0A0A8L5R7_9SACH|nr:unnamed protein product [Kluyveromyces dobzhanskii CBS 2104]
MTTTHEDSSITHPSYYYYVDPTLPAYEPQQPNPVDDLITVYGLEDMARQVARTNTDGTKAVKLRKSYKNQIQDLSGRFLTIPSRENGKGGEVSHIIFQNNPDMMNQAKLVEGMSESEYRQAMMSRDTELFESPQMDWDMCSTVIGQLMKSHPAEFKNSGFDVDDLAFDLNGTGTKIKKRRFKSNDSSTTSPNGDLQPDDLKRRRLE